MQGALSIGFVGFGEAAYYIAKGLRQPGIAQITAYDIHTHAPGLGDKIQQRTQETGTRLVETNEELVRSSEIVFSTVTANQAALAGEPNAPYLVVHPLHAAPHSVSPR